MINRMDFETNFSFFEIRIIEFVTFFLILYIFIGPSKDVFSAPICLYKDRLCEITQYDIMGTSSGGDPNYNAVHSGYYFDPVTGDLIVGEYIPVADYKRVRIYRSWICPNGMYGVGTTGAWGKNFPMSTEVEGEMVENAYFAHQEWIRSKPCGHPCAKERETAITSCGDEQYVDWTSWSDETCSGAKCKKPVLKKELGPKEKCND